MRETTLSKALLQLLRQQQSISIRMAWSAWPTFRPVLSVDMFDSGPWINPQTSVYTFALLRYPHWQHYSLYLGCIYGSYLRSQGILLEAKMTKRTWDEAQIPVPAFPSSFALHKIFSLSGPWCL